MEVGVSRRGGSTTPSRNADFTLRADFGEKGRRPPTTVGVRVAERLPFRVVSKYL